MAYTLADVPMLKVRLAEAELAAHNLLIGKSTQALQYEGKSITYTQANRVALLNYISDLKSEIGALEGGVRIRRAPVYMTF